MIDMASFIISRYLVETKSVILRLNNSDHNWNVKWKTNNQKIKGGGGGQPLYAAAAAIKVPRGLVIPEDGTDWPYGCYTELV